MAGVSLVKMASAGCHWTARMINNISSGYSFVPSGNYPLPVPVLTKISRHHVVSFSHNELTIPTCPPHLSDDHRRPGRLHEPRVGSASLSHSYVMVGRGALPQWHGRSHVNWRHSGICWAWVGSQSWSLCRHSMWPAPTSVDYKTTGFSMLPYSIMCSKYTVFALFSLQLLAD